MKADQQIWESWAKTLKRRGMATWVATLLEAAGPFTLLGAQAIYITHPIFRNASLHSTQEFEALARLLEDSQQTSRFVRILREEE